MKRGAPDAGCAASIGVSSHETESQPGVSTA